MSKNRNLVTSLRKAWIERNLSQREIGRQAGVSDHTIGNWLAGRSTPTQREKIEKVQNWINNGATRPMTVRPYNPHVKSNAGIIGSIVCDFLRLPSQDQKALVGILRAVINSRIRE